jgi:LAS superfamily LD-carboxypeptidase LdcB
MAGFSEKGKSVLKGAAVPIGTGLLAFFLRRLFGVQPEVSPDDGVSMSTPSDDADIPLTLVQTQGTTSFYLEPAAAAAFARMEADAHAAGIQLPISTAYRSRTWQQRLYDAYQAYLAGKGPWAPQAARPGTSLHEKGKAIDFNGVDPAKSNYNPARRAWLLTHGPQYGWINVGMTFKNKEPWHFEFKAPKAPAVA